MKALFLLVLIYNLQNVRPFGGSDETSMLMKYPSKLNPIYKHHQKLVNSGPVHKRDANEMWNRKSMQRARPQNSPYSVFPSKLGAASDHFFSAPESPLFPLDFDFEHKRRIKKAFNTRNKRSVSNATNDDSPTEAVDASSKSTVGLPKEIESKSKEPVNPKENIEIENKGKETVKPKESVPSGNKPKETGHPDESKQKQSTPKETVKHAEIKVGEKKSTETGKTASSKLAEKKIQTKTIPKASKLRQQKPKVSINHKESKNTHTQQLRDKRPKTAVKPKENKLRNNPKLKKPKDKKRQGKLRENKHIGNRTAVKAKRDSVRHKKGLRTNKVTGNKTVHKTQKDTVILKSKARSHAKNNNQASKVRSRRDLPINRGIVSKRSRKSKSRPQLKLRNKRYNETVGENGKGRSGRVGKKRPRKSLRQSNVKGDKDSRRLISSRDVSPEDYPYMVSIQKDNEHWCSGAILNRRLIISTANCFWKSHKVTRLKARIGSRDVDSGGQLARIQEVMKHPRWDIRRPPDNDVALAVLDRTIKFSHSVHAVDLPNRAMLPPFDDAWVTSFGAERRDGVYMQHTGMSLQMYHAHLINPIKCNNITQRFGVPVSENFICLSQTGRRAPCTRDTGAPAVSDGILWGLASWGIRKLCGTERFPAMFSYMGSESNLDFIINATSYLMIDERENPMLDRLPRIPGKGV